MLWHEFMTGGILTCLCSGWGSGLLGSVTRMKTLCDNIFYFNFTIFLCENFPRKLIPQFFLCDKISLEFIPPTFTTFLSFLPSGAQAVHPRHLCHHPQGWLQGPPDRKCGNFWIIVDHNKRSALSLKILGVFKDAWHALGFSDQCFFIE